MLSLIASLFIATTFAETCIDKDEIVWTSFNNQLYLNGERFNMKGLSWFGFETGLDTLYGLDVHNMDWYFQWMVDRGFNAIRMPFASDFLNNDNGWNSYISAVMAAGEYGIFIMLDMHSKTEGAWTDGLYTIDQDYEIETWRMLAEKLVSAGAWNVLFVDVFNEPHDVTNDQWGDWLDFCEKVAEAVWGAGLDALIAVEGTNWDCQSDISCSWGENLIGVKNKGLTFDASKNNKFVWSPHVYGGDVRGDYSYSTTEWEAHWAYLKTQDYSDAAIVIGEFGTTYTGSMVNWLNDLVAYLVSIDQKNHFFWCLNPNSGDTGGLLKDDWTTEEEGKLAALAILQPSPSTVSVSSSSICVSGLGESATAPSGDSNPSPTPPPTSSSSSGSSSATTIQIMQNDDSNQYWMAIEFPNNDRRSKGISKLEYRDSNHNSWVSMSYESWGDDGAYSLNDGTSFSGNMHFRVTACGSTSNTWNVFNGISGGSTAYINVPGCSYTEEETGSTGSNMAAIAAIIICALLCVVCIGVGTWWYKKHYRLNKGEASFNTTAADTPEPSKDRADTPASHEIIQQTQDPEIEIEMNAKQDGSSITQQ